MFDARSYLSDIALLSDQVDKTELAAVLEACSATIQNNTPGDVVEFGCYVGTTSVHLAKLLQKTDKQLYLYDSFEGLPEKTYKDSSPAGEQFVPGELAATKKQVIRNFKANNVPVPKIKKAWFSDLRSNDIPAVISFAFLDGDYYESIKVPLSLIEDRLAPNAIIVVDDYQNEALPGAARAVDEWVSRRGFRVQARASLGIITNTAQAVKK